MLNSFLIVIFLKLTTNQFAHSQNVMMKEENENDDFVVIKLNVKPKIGVPPNLKFVD